ncbi:hypothetical protein [Candidatus Tisiphia endosymbiont of Neophilaenus lineatus]|uniref:hypothetical protein n=1 Tax=Candidatus Tisiphia endosymbiont of Neophilaenus lineatus TaxID=3139336 RepID=UPI0035CA0398
MSIKDIASKVTDLAYKVGSCHYMATVEQLYDKTLVGTGWNVLCNSADYANTNQYSYKSVALINAKTKEIHITSAGTKPNKDDILDDIRITFAYTPNKLEPLQNFVNKVIELVGGNEKVQEYTFSTSGHSLGGIISDLTSCEIGSRGFSFDKSVTFDNPGSKEVVQYAIRNNLFTGTVQTTIDELSEHCEVYNAKPNFINTTNTQLAKKIHLLVPDNKYTDVEVIESSGFFNYLYDKVGAVVNKCADYFGVTNVIEQIQSHKLSNFNQDGITYIPVESWNKGLFNKEKLIVQDSNQLKKQMKHIDSTGDDIVLLSSQEENDSSLVFFEKKEYDCRDIVRASCATEADLILPQGCGSLIEMGWDVIN